MFDDHGGELAHLGIDNAPRRMDFESNEQFLGRRDHDDGMPLDDAALRLWERGYFPEFQERPTPILLIDRLPLEHSANQRFFHPDDLNEASASGDARAERFAVEQAHDNGSPLAEDIGQHITLDDLEANRPPVSAYEDTPRLVGKLGNINLDRPEKPGGVAQLLDQVQKRVGEFSSRCSHLLACGDRARVDRLMAFLTCEPNQMVGALHPKAMPVILARDDLDRWLGDPHETACSLARPYNDVLMRIVTDS